jgi:ABC-type sugar transport system ATPase subunit
LEVEELVFPGGGATPISLTVHKGEIVGLAGLVGSGRSELARTIFGVERALAGEVRVNGQPLKGRHPREAIEAGVALLPESRKDQGLHMNLAVRTNLTLPHLDAISRWSVLDDRRERRESGRLLNELNVVPPRPERIVRTLSGGNQQKVLFGKWLFQRPQLLIADEPTRGVDVGAKVGIYELIVSLAADGMGVLLISSENEEILGLCHRVLVVRRGAIAAELSGEEITEEAVMHAAFGAAHLTVGGTR